VRRTIQLARVGAEAELLRLRTLAKRQVSRLILAVVGAVFLIATLVCAEIAGGMALALLVHPVWATLIMLGINLVIAAIFFVVAMSNSPSRVEQEALEVRKTAQGQLAQAMAFSALVGPTVRAVGGRKLYGLMLAGLTARYLGGRR